VPGGGSTRGTRRPDLIPGVNPYLNNDRSRLNPAAFSIPKPGTFGNLPRNYLRGPISRQIDLVLNKKFPIAESTNVEFRTEIFNIFNFTNFALPPSTLTPALGTAANQFQPAQPLAFAGSSAFGILNSTVERAWGLAPIVRSSSRSGSISRTQSFPGPAPGFASALPFVFFPLLSQLGPR